MLSNFKKIFLRFIHLFSVNRKELPVFLFLIFLSSLFWILSVLSKEYVSTVRKKVSFVNLPQDKILLEKNNISLDIHVKASGFVLLAKKINIFSKINLNVSDFLKKRKGDHWQYSWIASQSLVDLQESLSNNIQIIDVNPSRIKLSLSDKKSKTVPVKLISNVSFEHMYRLKNNIILDPNSVTLTGPSSILDTIKYINTTKLTLNRVKKSKSGEVFVEDIYSSEIIYSTKKISWILEVEQYTEGKITLPIIKKNVPDGYDLKVFPEKVDVYYKVSMDNFDLINKKMFNAYVYYNDSNNKLPILISNNSNLVSDIRSSNQNVEHILFKK